MADGSGESFEVLDELRRGVFSTVHLVRKVGGEDDGRSYAVKVLRKGPHHQTQEALSRSFLKERRVLEAVVEAPFLLHLHYAGDLTAVLEDLGFLPEDQARLVLAQLFTALHTLHSLGMMHRDVKAGNVLVDGEGNVVLADYGLCSEPAEEGCLVRRTFCGTIEYLAPEVLLRTPPGYTAAVDFWSAGVLGFELLTGSLPFDPEDEGDRKKIVMNIINQEPQYPPYLSPEAADLLRRLLSKMPHQRLGGQTADRAEVIAHYFFRGLDWTELPPPFAKIDEPEWATSSSEDEDSSEDGEVAEEEGYLPGFDLAPSNYKHSSSSVVSSASPQPGSSATPWRHKKINRSMARSSGGYVCKGLNLYDSDYYEDKQSEQKPKRRRFKEVIGDLMKTLRRRLCCF
ncbi:ribosomal protein S6 kinase beta-2-like [Bacillus rossius redtenbacheri]|uniref:ribosomal protein S6 kinase beta-2-like n=1 Tax=Bacillus rossius redtenbacheri TaxID=93214 RepID=UPI002FDCC038